MKNIQINGIRDKQDLSKTGVTFSTFNLSRSTLLEKKESNSTEVEIAKKKFYFTKKSGFFSFKSLANSKITFA